MGLKRGRIVEPRKLLVSLCLFLMLVVAFGVYVHAEHQVADAHRMRFISHGLASQLRQSSDDLTRMARTYVVTGDPRYRAYYQEIIDIRNGDRPRPDGYEYIYWDLLLGGRPRAALGTGTRIALLERMRQAGFGEQEMKKLAEAKANSDDLTKIEFVALALVGSGGPDFPGKRARAIEMMNDARYHLAKAAIMAPIEEAYELMDRRTAERVRDATFRASLARGVFAAGCLGTLLTFLLAYAAEVRHIDERRQAEEALRESAQYSRSLLEASLDPLVTISEAGKIMDVNEATVEATGVSRERLVGTDFSDYFTDPAAAAVGYETVWQEGSVRDYPLSIRHSSGKVTDVLYNATLYRDAEERVLGVFAAARDITERRRAEEERSALLAQTRHDAETKTKLLKEINHRVKNNLVALIGILLTEKKGVPPEIRPWAEESMGRVSARIRAMLTAHEMLSAAAWAPLRLSELAERVIRQSLLAAHSRGEVSLEVAASEACVSPRQASHVALVLNELATNTAKYGASMGDRLNVRVKIGEGEDFYTIEYRDDGPGYPESVLGGNLPSVGLGLVSSLVSSTLMGEVRLSNAGGALATVKILKEDLSTT